MFTGCSDSVSLASPHQISGPRRKHMVYEIDWIDPIKNETGWNG